MKKSAGIVLLAISMLIALPVLSFKSSAAAQNVQLATNATGQVYIEGELLIKFKGGPQGNSAALAVARHQHKVKRSLKHIGWQRISLPLGQTVQNALAKYQADPTVLAVEPNAVIFIEPDRPAAKPDLELQPQALTPQFPNDSLFPQLWSLTNIGAPFAWNITTGSTNVIVAVMDTGFYYARPDLTANMWRNSQETVGNGVDDDNNGFVDDIYGADTRDNDGDPYDEVLSGYSSHGTACAGVIGAVGNDGAGLVGVAWNVRIMGIRVNLNLGCAGCNFYADLSSIIEGQDYILGMKLRGENVRAVNMSFGVPQSFEFSQAQRDSVAALGNAGIVVVAGAGNDAVDIDASPFYPAAFDPANVISVGASTRSDRLADFSNFGRTNVDLVAPGSGVLVGGGFDAGPNFPYYYTSSGTSLSGPFVAGAVALLASVYPDATVLQLKEAILKTADTSDALKPVTLGGGRLNVARALLYLATNQPPELIFSPQPALVLPGATARFAISCGGTPPLKYQWFKGELPLLNATNEFYVTPSLSAAQEGYRAVVSNSFGTITSAPVSANIAGASTGLAAWGANQYGQSDVPANWTNLMAVAGGRWHTLALKTDGTVSASGWGYYGQTAVPGGLTEVKAVAATTYSSAALRSNGTITAWGYNPYGEVNVPGGLTDAAAMAGGQYHYLALKSNGTVVAWGANDIGQCNVPAGLSAVKAISAGFRHSLALQSNGTVVAWGDNTSGECNVPFGLNDAKAIVGANSASFALRSNGTVVTWGGNAYGQRNLPPGLSNVVAIAGYGHGLALKQDGTLVSWGAGTTNSGIGLDWGQALVPDGLSNVVAISTSGRHSFAVVSQPPALRIDLQASVPTLSWPDLPGYQLEYTTNLQLAIWLTNSLTPTVNNATMTLPLPSDSDTKFFRLRKP